MEVSIDLETYGLRPGAIIRSIGLVLFNREDEPGTFFDERIIIIKEDSCKAIGMHKEPDTVKWWDEQSQEAKDHLLTEYCYQTPIGQALDSVYQIYTDGNCSNLWSHGILADGCWMEQAYFLAGQKRPWGFRDHRDTRTLFDLANISSRHWDLVTKMVDGPKHNPLVDAKRQAYLVQLAHGILLND